MPTPESSTLSKTLLLFAILERMIVLTRKTAAVTPTGPETKKIIGQMINVVKNEASISYYEYGIFLKFDTKKKDISWDFIE